MNESKAAQAASHLMSLEHGNRITPNQRGKKKPSRGVLEITMEKLQDYLLVDDRRQQEQLELRQQLKWRQRKAKQDYVNAQEREEHAKDQNYEDQANQVGPNDGYEGHGFTIPVSARDAAEVTVLEEALDGALERAAIMRDVLEVEAKHQEHQQQQKTAAMTGVAVTSAQSIAQIAALYASLILKADGALGQLEQEEQQQDEENKREEQEQEKEPQERQEQEQELELSMKQEEGDEGRLKEGQEQSQQPRDEKENQEERDEKTEKAEQVVAPQQEDKEDSKRRQSREDAEARRRHLAFVRNAKHGLDCGYSRAPRFLPVTKHGAFVVSTSLARASTEPTSVLASLASSPASSLPRVRSRLMKDEAGAYMGGRAPRFAAP